MKPRTIDLDAFDLDAWQREGWHTEAACRGLNPDLFHPERGADASGAKQVCATCSVIDECLAWSLVHFERHGVWGGMAERERRPLRRKLIIQERISAPKVKLRDLEQAECGTKAGYSLHCRRREPICRACREARNAYEVERREVQRRANALP